MSSSDNELAVLGACLSDAMCVGQVADFIVPEDFYDERHQEIYRSVVTLFRDAAPISEATVGEELKERKRLKLAGGISYLYEITDALPDTSNVEFYAKKIKTESSRRALQWLGKNLADSDKPPAEIMNDAMLKLSEISASSLRSVPRPISEAVSRVCRTAIRISKDEEERKFISTGFPMLDKIWNGLTPSELVIIGAQPSMGKSALSLKLAKNVALQGHRVLFISLEMSENQVARRLAAEDSGIPYTQIQDGALGNVAQDNLEATMSRYSTIPLLIDDKAGQSIADIRVKAVREHARAGLGLLVVDYLQIAAKDPSDVGQVAMVSAGLKAIAKDLNIPVIACSQLSRFIDHRDNRRPRNSDLKQSSQVEQDADKIMFIWLPDTRKDDEIQLLTTKHRNGPCGQVMLKFEKENQRFHELEKCDRN